MSKLTVKQENFCNNYIETGNASEAYRIAYNCAKMKPVTVKVKASELLNNGNITVTIERIQKALREKSEISKEKVLEELRAIAFSDIRDYLNFNGKRIQFKSFKALTDSQAKAIENLKTGKGGVEMKLHGKSWTIERICKMLGYDSPTKSEITGKDGKGIFPKLDLSKLTDAESVMWNKLLMKVMPDPVEEYPGVKWH